MRFLKVKYAKSKVTLGWEVSNKKGDWDRYSMICSDEPKPEFKAALVALDRDVVDMCELPVDYLTRIVVTSVSFSYGGEKEVMGATVTAQMHLNKSNVALNLNTPHKVEEFYADDGGPKQLLTDGCIERLGDLTTQAEAYVNGDRAQGELFADQEKAKEEGLRQIAKDFQDDIKKTLGPEDSVTISSGGFGTTIKGEGRA